MDLFILIVFVCSFLSCHSTGITGANIYLSKEDDLKIERQLKLLNKPAVKTIKTWYGDSYDCVDFFKQPAFDHPLLKNYTSDFQVLPPSILKSIKVGRSNKVNKVYNKGLECPVGTVPIKRVTKDNLIRQTLSSKATENGLHEWATVKTRSSEARYSGGGASLSIHNPHVSGTQSSAARIKVTNGPDVIQAGWRVDKFLHHGDNRTRFFIHTDAGRTKCFNTLCPGFVLVNPKLPVSHVLPKISVQGGPIYEVKISFFRDVHGNWNLYIGSKGLLIGYWPSRLFTGLSGLASEVEWGGEIYAPPGATIPPMGSGGAYLKEDTNYDAYFGKVSTFNETSQPTNADDLESSTSTSHYHIEDRDEVDKDNFKHLVIYGGAGNT